MPEVDREIGEITATLKAVKENQDDLKELFILNAQRISDRITQHEGHDDKRFESVGEKIQKVQTRLAYFSGIAALLALLFEFYAHS